MPYPIGALGADGFSEGNAIMGDPFSADRNEVQTCLATTGAAAGAGGQQGE